MDGISHLQRMPSDQNFAGMYGSHRYGGSGGAWSPPLPTSQSLPHLPSPGGGGGFPSGGTNAYGVGSADYFSRPMLNDPSARSPNGGAHAAPFPESSKSRHPAYPGPLPHFPRQTDFPGLSQSLRALRSPYDNPSGGLHSGAHGGVLSSGGGGGGPLSHHHHHRSGSSSALTASPSRQHGYFSPPLPRADGAAGSPQGPASFTPLASAKDESYSARWGPSFGSTSASRHSSRALPESPRFTDSQEQNARGSKGAAAGGATFMGPPLPKLGSGGGGGGSSSTTSTSAGGPHFPVTAAPPNAHRIAPIRPVRSSEEDEEEDELVDEDDVGGAHQDTTNFLSRPLQLLAYASTAAARRQAHGGYRDPRSVAAAASLGLIPSHSNSSRLKVPTRKTSIATNHLGGQEPSTLENGNWEYKAGRVRALKASGEDEQSPGSLLSDDAGTIVGTEHSNASVGAASGAGSSNSDTGPHLGKRRRSDDEPLPLPSRSRRQSMKVPAAEQQSAGEGGDAAKHAGETGAASNAADQDATMNEEAEVATTDVAASATAAAAAADDTAAGASRKGYFRFSLYSSKLDVDDKDDPIQAGVATLKEVEDLFDVYFNQINPINVIFDPFLHSLAYVRARSKFLLTVIAAHAARMAPGERNAELAVKLEEHWRVTLLPNILLGGYKSVEISQAFLLASQFHRPTHIIVEDRAWQYLGFAIRTATEIGVNISLAPSAQDQQEDEQVARRLRNRERLWLSLVVAEGVLSTQFGRPSTLSSSRDAITHSSHWNREDYALPEDAALMCQIELRKIVEQCAERFDKSVGVGGGGVGGGFTQRHQRSRSAYGGAVADFDEEQSVALTAAYKTAWQELERWKRTWCPADESMDHTGIGGSMATSAFLVRWSPYSRLIYYYWRCHLNSIVLQMAGGGGAAGRHEFASPVAYDSMVCAGQLLDTLLDSKQIGAKRLALAPNAVVVMATYAAVSALRLTKLDHSRHALIDQRGIFDQVQRLAGILEAAGQTPGHRDGAAGPYGLYLRSVLALFDSDSKSSSSVSGGGADDAAATTTTVADILGDTASDPLAAMTSTAAANTSSTDAAAAAAAADASALLADPDLVSSAAAALNEVYASDSEVWEYLANGAGGSASGAGAGAAVGVAGAPSAPTALWPSTSAPWNGP